MKNPSFWMVKPLSPCAGLQALRLRRLQFLAGPFQLVHGVVVLHLGWKRLAKYG